MKTRLSGRFTFDVKTGRLHYGAEIVHDSGVKAGDFNFDFVPSADILAEVQAHFQAQVGRLSLLPEGTWKAEADSLKALQIGLQTTNAEIASREAYLASLNAKIEASENVNVEPIPK